MEETGRKGLVGPDPGTLSPEQLEQLRDFKVRELVSPKTRFYQSEAPLGWDPSDRKEGPRKTERGLVPPAK